MPIAQNIPQLCPLPKTYHNYIKQLIHRNGSMNSKNYKTQDNAAATAFSQSLCHTSNKKYFRVQIVTNLITPHALFSLIFVLYLDLVQPKIAPFVPVTPKTLYSVSVWVKNICPCGFLAFFPNDWEFFHQILRAYYTFLSKLHYKFVFI